MTDCVTGELNIQRVLQVSRGCRVRRFRRRELNATDIHPAHVTVPIEIKLADSLFVRLSVARLPREIIYLYNDFSKNRYADQMYRTNYQQVAGKILTRNLPHFNNINHLQQLFINISHHTIVVRFFEDLKITETAANCTCIKKNT